MQYNLANNPYFQEAGNSAYGKGRYDEAAGKYEIALGYIEGLLTAGESPGVTQDMVDPAPLCFQLRLFHPCCILT